jgi:hypothetical protein
LSQSARIIAPPLRTSIWALLEAELDVWAATGRIARFWWRDDDAIAPSGPLDRLLALARDLPLALAVIPEGVTDLLAERLAKTDNVTVLQHGIAHTNHAAPPAKKAELGADRPAAALAAALGAGRSRLEALFGGQFRPVLVPPWNRIAADLVPLLPAAGFSGLSTAGARRQAEPAPGLHQVNTHLDPVDWHGTRRCRPAAELVAETARQLAARRLGADKGEPVGFLTHHLLDDPATERFAADLARVVGSHPAATWVSARELWPA